MQERRWRRGECRRELGLAGGVYDRSEIQRLLTGEVNAAAEGLFTADVEEVIINDGHLCSPPTWKR